jgi:hypothetical protein
LQESGLVINTAIVLIKSLKGFVELQRNDFDAFEIEAKGKCGHDSYKAASKRARIRNRQRDFDVGSAQAEDTIQSPRDRFRIESFLVIIDQLKAALKQRLDAYNEIDKKFGFLSKIATMSPCDISSAADCLLRFYPDDLENSLECDLLQFSALLQSLETKDNGNNEPKESKEIIMYLLLKNRDITQTFPNVEIVLRIYLCMLVSNCTGERSFSKLKRIKNELRNRTSQDRLNMLALLSIEH